MPSCAKVIKAEHIAIRGPLDMDRPSLADCLSSVLAKFRDPPSPKSQLCGLNFQTLTLK